MSLRRTLTAIYFGLMMLQGQANAQPPKCQDVEFVLESFKESGLSAVDLDRDVYLEQRLLDPQLWRTGTPNKDGTKVTVYCVYDVMSSGHIVKEGRVTGFVYSTHPTPTFVVCDESCKSRFIISDTEFGLQELNRLLAALSTKGIASGDEAVDVARLASAFVKRNYRRGPLEKAALRDGKYSLRIGPRGNRFTVHIRRDTLAVSFTK